MANTLKKNRVPEADKAEDRIRSAARKVFLEKGYAATKTRDIASEAGLNLALLNYYFRSKEKLFEVIILESMQNFLAVLGTTLNQKELNLEEKINRITDLYFTLLQTQPELPVFLLSELRRNPGFLNKHLPVRSVIMQSDFYRQLKLVSPARINPMHFLVNLLAMVVFPFIAAPMLMHLGNYDQKSLNKLIKERKRLIPVWMNQLLNQKS